MPRYFVCKSENFSSLRKCVQTGVWACKDRDTTPQPRDLLEQALGEGQVILVFSVANCHGWHGYCQMLTPPGSVSESDVSNDEKSRPTASGDPEMVANEYSEEHTTNMTNKTNIWHKFHVQWITVFLKEFGERCLSSQSTSDMCNANGQQVNKFRNLQELTEDIGKKICELIDSHYETLSDQRKQQLEARLAQQPKPFLTQVHDESDNETVWKQLVAKVEIDLGKVLLACPFGSQRYNLQTADSDVDMFIVYQADTSSVLGLNPPKHTVKNREQESFDYTVLEVHRYCELLVTGDPRCVETLFLHPSSIVHCSKEWLELRSFSKHFLTSLCLDKYLRDALGSNGLKQFDKWFKDKPPQDLLPSKMCKLVYIIVRLLQNARDVTLGTLNVYRPDESMERKQLQKIRSGQVTGQEAKDMTRQLIEAIETKRINLKEPQDDMKRKTEDWLVKLRFSNFTKNYEYR